MQKSFKNLDITTHFRKILAFASHDTQSSFASRFRVNLNAVFSLTSRFQLMLRSFLIITKRTRKKSKNAIVIRIIVIEFFVRVMFDFFSYQHIAIRKTQFIYEFFLRVVHHNNMFMIDRDENHHIRKRFRRCRFVRRFVRHVRRIRRRARVHVRIRRFIRHVRRIRRRVRVRIRRCRTRHVRRRRCRVRIRRRHRFRIRRSRLVRIHR
jgi:hypothetical protein